MLAGCTGDIGSSLPPGLTPEQGKALQLWTAKALPVFRSTCLMCHDGSMPDIGYLAGTSDVMVRDTVVAFLPQVVNFNAPQASLVLKKGMHMGPALLATQASDILEWLTAERDARPPGMVIETALAPVMPCMGGVPGSPTCPVNKLDLSALGSMGSTFEFVATDLPNSSGGHDLYVTDMKFVAGPVGLYLEHPWFATYPPAGTGSGSGSAMPMAVRDPLDSYATATFNLPATMAKPLGGGENTFSGFAIADPLTVRFDVVDIVHP